MKLYIVQLVILVLLLCRINYSCAQLTYVDRSEKKLYLKTFVGYGTENNQGNTAFFAGIVLSKPITRHIFLEGGLTRFTTDIYNVYKAKPTNFDNEERNYNAWFLTPDFNYTLGSKNSLLNASIKIGPALKYYNYKVFSNAVVQVYADGRKEAIPSTLKYEEKQGFNFSLYNSISFDAKVTSKLRLGVFLDVYSSLIPIEHFMPGINAIFKL